MKNVEKNKFGVVAMESSEPTIEKAGILVRIGCGFTSFLVGLAAFFVLKLIFMVFVNLLAFAMLENKINFELVNFGFILLSIYGAFKYTKKLNKSGTKKSRIKKRILTMFFGFISMIISTTAVFLSRL